MASSIEFIFQRAHATGSAQADIEGTWVWDEKTVAGWDTDIAAAHTQEEVVADAGAAKDGLAGELAVLLDALHDETVKGLSIAKAKYRNDPGKLHLFKNLSANANSRAGQLEEALEFESAWQAADAAWLPVAGMTLAGFKTARLACETKLEDYTDSKANWRGEAEKFNVMMGTLEDACIGWYKAATAVFPEGTAEGDMIRGTVPTTYTPPPDLPLPEQAEVTLVDVVGSDGMEIAYTATYAASFDIFLQSLANPAFVLVAANRTETGFVFTGLVAGDYQTKVVPKNATGAGPESGVASFSIS
jgi:hypothetical protein